MQLKRCFVVLLFCCVVVLFGVSCFAFTGQAASGRSDSSDRLYYVSCVGVYLVSRPSTLHAAAKACMGSCVPAPDADSGRAR